MRKLRILFISILIVTISSAKAQQNYFVYAAMMHHFAKYTEWPSSMNSGDFVVGVVGNTPAYDALVKLASAKKVGSRKIVVKKFASAANVGKCHMVFVPSSQSSNLTTISNKVKTNNTVVVSEKSENKQSFIFNFIIDDGGRTKFQLNKSRAKAHGVKISPELVKLAVVVG